MRAVPAGLLAAALVAALPGCGTPPPAGEPVRITIPRGASLTAVAYTLHANGIIRSTRWFRLYATALRRDRAIQAGIYDLHRDRPVREVLAVLVSGRAAFQRLAIPEGLMLGEVAAEVGASARHPDRHVPGRGPIPFAGRAQLHARLDPFAAPNRRPLRTRLTPQLPGRAAGLRRPPDLAHTTSGPPGR